MNTAVLEKFVAGEWMVVRSLAWGTEKEAEAAVKELKAQKEAWRTKYVPMRDVQMRVLKEQMK